MEQLVEWCGCHRGSQSGGGLGQITVGLLDGAHSVEEIAGVIAEEYDVAEAEAQADVRAFVGELEAHGMLAGEEK